MIWWDNWPFYSFLKWFLLRYIKYIILTLCRVIEYYFSIFKPGNKRRRRRRRILTLYFIFIIILYKAVLYKFQWLLHSFFCIMHNMHTIIFLCCWIHFVKFNHCLYFSNKSRSRRPLIDVCQQILIGNWAEI